MMNSSICWLMVRLAILLGVLLVHSSEGATYRSFANSHILTTRIGNTNLNALCDRFMRHRWMTSPRCRPINTFILSGAGAVKSVCSRGGTLWQRNLYDSRRRFSLLVCRLTGGSPPNGCRYRGRRENRRVRLGCVRHWPVHYQQSL